VKRVSWIINRVFFLTLLVLPAPLFSQNSSQTLDFLYSLNDHQYILVLIFGILFIIIILITYLFTLIKEKKRYASLLKNSNETILICNSQGDIKECINGEIKESSLLDHFEQENKWELQQGLQTVAALKTGQKIRLNLTRTNSVGEQYYQMVLQNMTGKREIRGIIVNITDISEAKLLEKRLIQSREMAYHEARHDHLTSVPNRLYFYEAINRHFARLKRHNMETMCLLMIDIDHFKKVNDTRGHDKGDLVLIQLSKLCSDLIRITDVFARYGGEEFICYLDDLNMESALEVAERMRQKVEDANVWPEGIKITISIGIVEYSGEEIPEDLIKKADIALYRAKATGRNKICIYPGDNQMGQ